MQPWRDGTVVGGDLLALVTIIAICPRDYPPKRLSTTEQYGTIGGTIGLPYRETTTGTVEQSAAPVRISKR